MEDKLGEYNKMKTRMKSFCSEFMQGERDCIAGVPHEEGKSDAYTRGYGTRYQALENDREMSRFK